MTRMYSNELYDSYINENNKSCPSPFREGLERGLNEFFKKIFR